MTDTGLQGREEGRWAAGYGRWVVRAALVHRDRLGRAGRGGRRHRARLGRRLGPRAVTAAGVTLAVSFGLLALVPLDPFRELAFAMAIGILLDAIVVRSLLIPSLLTLVGTVSGWPGARLLPEGRLTADRPPSDPVRVPGPAPAARPALVSSISLPNQPKRPPARPPGATVSSADRGATGKVAPPLVLASGITQIVVVLIWWRGRP